MPSATKLLKAWNSVLENWKPSSTKTAATAPGAEQRLPKKPRAGKGSKKGRKPGGQPIYKGSTLKMVPSEEAKIENHYPAACSGCGAGLSKQPSSGYERRQVFDIPPIKIAVTEHRAHYACCPCCGERTQSSFPAEATNNAVYGPTCAQWQAIAWLIS
ncbi:MAG: IS66 family transposase zinc-finger binding domain-containing protein [Lewinellaceae bacterium]|nr:IS66 family transposase zinc-finger binding domain-containing protein [Lewinellaceae bacterium]